MPVTTDPQRSLFVTLFAATISFIGLGVSILAVWILWLVPRARPAMPEVQLKKPKPDKARRRSAPPVLFPSTASSSLSPPSPLIPIITVASKGADSSGRHVSFLDSQIRTRRNTRRYSAPPEPVHPDYEEFSDSSPLSSSSTLVATPSSKHVNVLTPIISEAGESSATDSDSSRRSSRSSPLLSYRMSKMKNPLGKKTRKSSIDATDIMKELSKPTRSASLGFVDMWQRSRPQTAPEASNVPSDSRPQPYRRSSGSQASPGPSSPSSPGCSYFPFKPSRRVSNPTPVPRTQPYMYPYFAAPPVGTPQDYVKFSLQVEGTIRSNGSTTVAESSCRAVEKKEANAQAQASLGYGRRPSGRRVVSALP